MDISELKKLLKSSTSVVILENGQPNLVMMDYQAYCKLIKDNETELSVTKSTEEAHTTSTGSNPLMPSEYNSIDHRMPSLSEHLPPSERTDNGREVEILERLNREIMMLKHQIELEEQKNVAEVE